MLSGSVAATGGAAEGRPNFAPTNSPGPVRRPNPITGFDRNDDFPLRDLAIVRSWDRDDLVVDYRGPYHLINTAMNLVAGNELAWQERMAESFILSPLYCGSKTTGYRRSSVVRSDLENDEVEPEEAELKTVACSARLWRRHPPGHGRQRFGCRGQSQRGLPLVAAGHDPDDHAQRPARPLVRQSRRIGMAPVGPTVCVLPPGRAVRPHDEQGQVCVSLRRWPLREPRGLRAGSPALPVHRRLRRRGRPGLSFWDLGSLVRKCRQDFGVRIEIDISPLLKKEGTPYAKWHCAVGQIHYDEVDIGALPGTLVYIKPSLSGDEPSDVRNYVVEHPTFPHEPTADQFFSESQFESYRVLGEHIAQSVFRDVVRDVGPDSSPAALFSRLRRRWAQAPPNLDKDFLESMKPFVKIHEALRTDPKLESLSQELYPESHPASRRWPRSRGGPAHGRRPRPRPCRHRDAPGHGKRLDRGEPRCLLRSPAQSRLDERLPPLDQLGHLPGSLARGPWRVQPRVRAVLRERAEPHGPRAERRLARGTPAEGRKKFPLPRFREGLRELDKEFSLEWPHIVLDEIGDGHSGLVDMFKHACKHPPVPGKWPMAVLIVPRRDSARRATNLRTELLWRDPRLGVARRRCRPRRLVARRYRTLGLGEAIKKTLKELKEELKTASKPAGYTLRTRYPSDGRSRGKQRWQKTLWSDFFQNQGFHHDDFDSSVNDPDTLLYRWAPR